jgi:hypothetical protein
MNSAHSSSPQRSLPVTAEALRHPVASDTESHERYRARDFGIGYGTSSGYAQTRRYVPSMRCSPFSVR